jgi:hypothetical protein
MGASTAGIAKDTSAGSGKQGFRVNEVSVLLIGFLLGLRHATDPDHLAAVATLAVRHHSLAQSLRQGVAWGIGHSVVLLIVGGIVLGLGASIPHGASMALELAVGVMLVALGIDVLRRLVRKRIHVHVHTHEPGMRHVHAHSHLGGHSHDPAQHEHNHAGRLPWRALAIGMTHGMAGSAGLIVLSLGAVQSWTTGVLFIALFGAGSIAGMATLSIAIAIPLRITAVHVGRLFNALTAAIGGFSCALGLLMIARISYLHALPG